MKRLLLVLCTTFIVSKTFAQFQIDLGGGLAISNNKEQNFLKKSTNSQGQLDTSFYTYKVSASGVGLYVYPKYHFKEVAKHSLSLGCPILLGLSASTSTQGESTSSFIYDFNVSLDINGGKLNKKRYTDSKIGYFAGIGLGIINTNGIGFEGGSNFSLTAKSSNLTTVELNEEIEDKMTARNTGFMIHAGLVVPFMFKEESGKNMGIRLFIKPGLGKTALTYFGATAFVSFGKSPEKPRKSKKK